MAAKPWVVLPLVLPVGDKEYAIQPCEYDTGLAIIAQQNEPEADGVELVELCMGETWAEMKADRCPYPVMFRAGMAAVQYQAALVGGLDGAAAVEVGENMWNGGLDPETMAALVAAADLSSKPPETSKTSTSTGTAKKTPPRASGRTTKSPPATPQTGSRKAPAKRSAGTPSSSSGP